MLRIVLFLALQDPPSIQDLIRQLGHEELRRREAATDALSARGKEALPALLQAFASPDPEIRGRARDAVRRFTPAGLEAALEHDDPEVRALATEGGKSTAKRSLDSLDAIYRDLPKGHFCGSGPDHGCTDCWGKLTTSKAHIERLEALLIVRKTLDDPDRIRALDHLVAFDRKSGKTPIPRLNDGARRKAAEFIGEVLSQGGRNARPKALEAVRALGFRDLLPKVRAYLRDPESDRRGVIEILAFFEDRDAIPDLIERLEDPSSTSVSRAAAGALGTMKVRAAIPALVGRLQMNPQDGDFNDSVIQALGRIGDPSAIAPLRALVRERAGRARLLHAVLPALWELRDPEVRKDTLLAFDETPMGASLQETLLRICLKERLVEAAPLIARDADAWSHDPDANAWLLNFAVEALVQFEHREAAPLLSRILRKCSHQAATLDPCHHASYGLLQLSHETDVPQLRDLLRHVGRRIDRDGGFPGGFDSVHTPYECILAALARHEDFESVPEILEWAEYAPHSAPLLLLHMNAFTEKALAEKLAALKVPRRTMEGEPEELLRLLSQELGVILRADLEISVPGKHRLEIRDPFGSTSPRGEWALLSLAYGRVYPRAACLFEKGAIRWASATTALRFWYGWAREKNALPRERLQKELADLLARARSAEVEVRVRAITGLNLPFRWEQEPLDPILEVFKDAAGHADPTLSRSAAWGLSRLAILRLRGAPRREVLLLLLPRSDEIGLRTLEEIGGSLEAGTAAAVRETLRNLRSGASSEPTQARIDAILEKLGR